MILKTITFNICHGQGLDGKVDVKRQARQLRKYQPDIVFLQEVDMYTKRSNYSNEIRLFGKEVGLPYSSMESNITLEEGYYGDGIVSRFPIAFSTNYIMPLTKKENEQRGILRNKISFGTTKLNLFSVHLSTHEKERIMSVNELMKIISKINDNSAIIVAGDFNVGVTRLGKGKYIYEDKEKFEEYEILKQKLEKIDNKELTWFSNYGNACIDTMFYSNNIKLVKYKTIKTEYSDHSAIYAEFDI